MWWRAAPVIGIATLLLALLAGLALRQERLHRRDLLLGEGSHRVALQREFLSLELRSVRSDLLFLSQQPLLTRLLAGEPLARAALEREWAGFARSKPVYDQIRLLDGMGREVVRVNQSGEQVEVVEESELQMKASRYYFREAMELETGQVFVSPLDLNVERGQIEKPPRPMIRLATPVFAGQRRALLVLNYAGTRLLAKLREIAAGSPGDTLLVNLEGEYLQASDPEREWGWLLGHSASFRDDHPEAWQQIRSASHAQLVVGDDLFTSERISLAGDDPSPARGLLIVSRVSVAEGTAPAVGAGRLLLGLGTWFTIVALSLTWARASAARRFQEDRIAESEARLRALSSRLLAAQEEERRSLSRMLHDELGQQVTAIALDLKGALRRGVDASIEPMLRRAAAETDGVLAGLHEMATRVRPSVLDDLGLKDAIESFVSEYEERTGISVAAELRLPPEELPGALGENLYRILQEALANAAAHSGTRSARVELVAGPEQVSLSVEDEGCGFDPAILKGGSRLGVLGMRERVELLGGDFELDTAPGRGTRIHVRLPAAAA